MQKVSKRNNDSSFLITIFIFHYIYLYFILHIIVLGDTKRLAPEDRKHFAAELVKAAKNEKDENTTRHMNETVKDMEAAIWAENKNKYFAAKQEPIKQLNASVDIDTWRAALLYLKTNYDIGSSDKSSARSHENFQYGRDNAALKVYSRVENMRENLRSVINLRTDRNNVSKFGQHLHRAIALESQLLDGSEDKKNEFSMHNTLPIEEVDKRGINIYADNLSAEINRTQRDGKDDKGDTKEADILQYEDIYNPSNVLNRGKHSTGNSTIVSDISNVSDKISLAYLKSGDGLNAYDFPVNDKVKRGTNN